MAAGTETPASQKACSHTDCDQLVGRSGAKGMCPTHYTASKPPCSIEGCEKRSLSRGWCSMHVNRWRQTGNPLTTPTGVTHEGNRGVCDVKGCDQPARKRTWCASHYQQWRVEGSVRPFLYKWATDLSCVVCGAPCRPGSGRRKHCSDRCAVLDSLYSGTRPRVALCVQCDDPIDLLQLTKAGQFKRVDTKLCAPCRCARGMRHGKTLKAVAQHSGTVCNICDKPVDMALKHPDPMRASVDHIHPYAHGGSHDLENLHIAHLHCNQVKSSRIGFKVT